MLKKIFLLLLIVIPVFSFAQVKYEKSLEIDSQIGLRDSEGVHYRFGVDMVNGLRISPLLSFGLGIGVQTCKYEYEKRKDFHDIDYVISTKNTTFLPVYFRAKLNLTRKKISPFVAFNIGYLFDVGDTSLVNSSCLLAEGDVGIDIPIKENSKVYIMIGYTSHKSQLYYSYFSMTADVHDILSRTTNMISIRAGFAF